MKKKSLVLASGAAIAVLLVVTGGLNASNMGFKLNYQLNGAGGSSLDGTNTISLPYNPQSGIVDADDLRLDIQSSTGVSVINVQTFRRTDNGITAYAGTRGQVPFTLNAGESYRVRMQADANYIVVGSHDPDATIDFLAAAGGVSLDGTNTYSHPYHGTASNADELRQELGAGNVINVQQFRRSDNGITAYAGTRGQVPFALEAGKGYRVRVSNDVLNFRPSHF